MDSLSPLLALPQPQRNRMENSRRGHKKILEEIIVESFPKIGEEIATQVQETQRVPNRMNPRRNT